LQNGVQFQATTGNVFSADQYSSVVLLPSQYFNNYTYASLATVPAYTTYSALDAYINSLGPLGYGNLLSDGVPKVSNAFQAIIYQFKPAGLRVFVGAY
jgi:hypothetical protein